MKLAFVLGTTAGGTGRHVQTLVAGCAVRGIPSVVAGPGETQLDFGFGAPVMVDISGDTFPGDVRVHERPGPAPAGAAEVRFEAVQFGDRPNVRDGLAVLRLRQVLARAGAGVVHAHGLRAGVLAALALSLRPSAAPVPLVVTVHNAPPSSGLNAAIYQALELVVARSATTVLCVSADLEARMRRAGARDVGRALVPSLSPAGPATAGEAAAVRQDLGLDRPGRRPLVLAAGRLAPQKGFATLIEAARRWQDLSPAPLLAIAGSGPLRTELIAAAAPLGESVRFLGHRDDIPALLAAADLFVLPSLWEGQPLILQEALRAGRPIVATQVGGIPGLTGTDGALLVPAGDPAGLAAAVRRVLTSDALARGLAEAALARARLLPSENDAIEAALAVYRRLTTAALASGAGPAA